jgi:hypothetical protein
MSDKKVDRPSRNSASEHVQPPMAKHAASSNEDGTFDAPRRADDKGKASLLERFRERDAHFRGEYETPDEAAPQAGPVEAGAEPHTEPDSDAAADGGPEADVDVEGGAT